jgi:hypothetical protein
VRKGRERPGRGRDGESERGRERERAGDQRTRGSRAARHTRRRLRLIVATATRRLGRAGAPTDAPPDRCLSPLPPTTSTSNREERKLADLGISETTRLRIETGAARGTPLLPFFPFQETTRLHEIFMRSFPQLDREQITRSAGSSMQMLRRPSPGPGGERLRVRGGRHRPGDGEHLRSSRLESFRRILYTVKLICPNHLAVAD